MPRKKKKEEIPEKEQEKGLIYGSSRDPIFFSREDNLFKLIRGKCPPSLRASLIQFTDALLSPFRDVNKYDRNYLIRKFFPTVKKLRIFMNFLRNNPQYFDMVAEKFKELQKLDIVDLELKKRELMKKGHFKSILTLKEEFEQTQEMALEFDESWLGEEEKENESHLVVEEEQNPEQTEKKEEELPQVIDLEAVYES